MSPSYPRTHAGTPIMRARIHTCSSSLHNGICPYPATHARRAIIRSHTHASTHTRRGI
eukprot:JP439133.1.p3 GENE.JP439133.1~~JP439133.1.p3  ORF type:complete len:58 (+),score=3.37 JP439133.1:95-268(+)